MRAHLADRNGRPLCGDRPWHFQTTSRFAQTRCIACVQLVRNAATDAGLQDPCRPR